jgi:O-antigen/teichoic acid export membrane protein
MLKSVAVVIGSYLLSIVLVLLSDPLLSRLFPGDFEKGHIPSNAALAASTAFFVLVSIFCAWVCARFAPSRAERHVLWFCILGEVMGVAATIPNWSKGWPHWYWLSWLLSWPLSCWIGLLLGQRRGGHTSAVTGQA